MPEEIGFGNPMYYHRPGARWGKEILTYAALCDINASDPLEVENCWHTELYFNKFASGLTLGLTAFVAGALYMF